MSTGSTSNDSQFLKGVTVRNKSSHSVIFIRGITVKGWPLQINLQVKSETQAESIRISLNFLRDYRSV